MNITCQSVDMWIHFFGKEKNGNGTVIANIWHQIANVKLKIGAPWPSYTGSIILSAPNGDRWHSEFQWAIAISQIYQDVLFNNWLYFNSVFKNVRKQLQCYATKYVNNWVFNLL